MYDKRTTKKKTAELLREMTCAPRAHYAEQSHSQFTSREESNRIANCLQIVVSYYNLVSQENFNPRSPWGERHQASRRGHIGGDFNPRSPWGERQSRFCLLGKKGRDFNPRSRHFHPQAFRAISIHAPRGGERRRVRKPPGRKRKHFNPRSPWGERRYVPGVCLVDKLFQSTLPVGGATLSLLPHPAPWAISIHAPRVGSDLAKCVALCSARISIHAPRGGSDVQAGRMRKMEGISIHAPRGGSDVAVEIVFADENAISIHAPRGGSDIPALPPR